MTEVRDTVKRARSRAAGGEGVSFETPSGSLVLLEESHDLPLVDFEISFRTGSVFDPEGKTGLTRLMGRMLRMGTSRLDGNAVEETIARLGGRLTIETAPSFMRLHGTVIKRNVDPFVELIAALLTKPAFRAHDVSHVKRETLADIEGALDNDRALAARALRRRLFSEHPYGRPVIGHRSDVRSIRRTDVARHYEEHFVGSNLIFGAAGDLTRYELEGLVERHFSSLPGGKAPKRKVPAPKRPKGRRLIIVDKPDRTQTQTFVGTSGSKVTDPDVDALSVANTAFGGTFTARLMNEVRSKRGWSYGAYSRLGQDRQRDAWYMWTFPAAKDVAACLSLELELLEGFVGGKLTGKEVQFAKNFLANSHCFDVDTAAKRLDARVDCEVYGLPRDHYRHTVKRVRGVKLADAREAVKRRLSSKDLVITVTATAKDVRDELEKLPGLRSVEVVPYDRD